MTKRKMKKRGHGTLARCPKSHYLSDCARDLTQARQIAKAYPKKTYNTKIVRTPKYKVFPYHIATLKKPKYRKK